MANPNEVFVAECLKTYFAINRQKASYDFPESDPPDIIMKIDDKSVDVEISDLNINTLNDRNTIDKGYLKYIETLDYKFGAQIPNNQKIFIGFYHFYHKVSSIRKKFEKQFLDFISGAGSQCEEKINEVAFKIEKIETPHEPKRKIAGFTTAYGGRMIGSRDIKAVEHQLVDSNLSVQTFSMIKERIDTKSKKCQNLNSQNIWLALYDKYYAKFTNFKDDNHKQHYNEIFQDIQNFGIFQKIFIVFENGDVLEFSSN